MSRARRPSGSAKPDYESGVVSEMRMVTRTLNALMGFEDLARKIKFEVQ